MKEGPQPPKCILNDCDAPPAQGDVMCLPHVRSHAANGTATTLAIAEPDDPALLEREAKRAAAQEAKELADRRRVKTWRTFENGIRVPDTFWSEEELAAMEEAVAGGIRAVRTRGVEIAETPEGVLPMPDMATMEPVWKDGQWVLRPKTAAVDLDAVRSLVRDLMMELGIREEGGDDHA